MIAKLDIKKCPMRKEIIMDKYDVTLTGFPVKTIHKEYFFECIDKECTFWDADNYTCYILEMFKESLKNAD